MSHASRRFSFRSSLVFLALAVLAPACRGTQSAVAPAVSADAVASVDGHEITRTDLDKAYNRARDSNQTLSDEETMTAKLNLLNELIMQEILHGKATALKLDVSESELDTAYNNAKKNVPDATFEPELKRRGLTPLDMREGLRREMIAQKVIDHEVGGKISVTEKEISDFFNANRAQFNVPEEAYHIAQIVVTPVRDQQLTNGTGDDARTPQEAAAKVQMLMERLKAGASFQDLALGYSEDPESAPRGGDLGFVPVSRLKQAPPALRDAVLNKAPGAVNVVNMGGVLTLVLVVAHESAGQRDLTMPEVRNSVTQTLRGRRETMLRTAFLTVARNDAKVANYLARRVTESQGSVPNLQLPAPGAK
jgi:peptidyl-prolyl cis-trans isomerase SurA